jgi:hypothetical protein
MANASMRQRVGYAPARLRMPYAPMRQRMGYAPTRQRMPHAPMRQQMSGYGFIGQLVVIDSRSRLSGLYQALGGPGNPPETKRDAEYDPGNDVNDKVSSAAVLLSIDLY